MKTTPASFLKLLQRKAARLESQLEFPASFPSLSLGSYALPLIKHLVTAGCVSSEAMLQASTGEQGLPSQDSQHGGWQ